MSSPRSNSIRIRCRSDCNNNRKLMGVLVLWCVLSSFCLPAQAKYGGGSGTLEDPYLICTAEELHDIGTAQDDWDKHFKLIADIDLSNYSGSEFNIIGIGPHNPFTGSFDGNGHTISNFTYILTGATGDNIGLFGYVNGFLGRVVIKNLGLINPNIDAPTGDYVGSLVGRLFDGTITNCYARDGSVRGYSSVGGLVGGPVMTSMPVTRVIRNCYATTSVSGIRAVGGLVGWHGYGTISNCYAIGNVSGNEEIGGLVGYITDGKISDSRSTGRVLGISQVGGLVGYNELPGATISNCTSSTNVLADDKVGGLVGLNIYGKISNCYCTGSVSGASDVGGLAGVNQGTVSNCYSAGSVEGTTDVGGLVGSLNADPFYPDGTTSDSFWDVEASGQATSAAGASKTTAQMKQRATFIDWDFTEIWDIAENQTYPFLRQCVVGDINGDCRVDFQDLTILASHWLTEN